MNNQEVIILVFKIVSILISVVGISTSLYLATSKKKTEELASKLDFAKMNIEFLQKKEKVEKQLELSRKK